MDILKETYDPAAAEHRAQQADKTRRRGEMASQAARPLRASQLTTQLDAFDSLFTGNPLFAHAAGRI